MGTFLIQDRRERERERESEKVMMIQILGINFIQDGNCNLSNAKQGDAHAGMEK
jgi:hypothetical protein